MLLSALSGWSLNKQTDIYPLSGCSLIGLFIPNTLQIVGVFHLFEHLSICCTCCTHPCKFIYYFPTFSIIFFCIEGQLFNHNYSVFRLQTLINSFDKPQPVRRLNTPAANPFTDSLQSATRLICRPGRC